MNKIYLSIILPTYNEKGNILRLIKDIQRKTKLLKSEIIIVDDNSPDQTAQTVQNSYKKSKTVKVILRTKERGLASAIFTGIKASKGTYIIVMDTDFNHDPKEIPIMLKYIKPKTMVIGSRFVPGGGMENKTRQFLSFVFNLYLRILLGHNIHDNLSGYFIMRKKDLMTLTPSLIFYGFGDFFMRLIYKAYQQQYIFVEIPVFYNNRTYGVSKSQFLNMFKEYTLSALKLRFGK